MTLEPTQIQAFLRETAIETHEYPHIRKAGIIPFLPGKPLRYYVMTPVASKPDLGLPEFQLCKGTRMFKSANGIWQDMRAQVPEGAELESLPATALREGEEELGLKPANIARLLALGEYHFTSATNGKEIIMWLLAAEMNDGEDFLPQADIATTTAKCAWLTLAEFRKQGRPDHAHILEQIETRLLTCT